MTREELLKVKGPRVHKVRKSLGVYDVYKWLRKRKWKDIGQILTEHEFYSIIRKINNELANNLANGYNVKLPCKMGTLELIKMNTYVRFNNGKVENNLPIDWNGTLKLWCEDDEAYRNKTLVKLNEKEYFKIHYDRFRATYENKIFFTFKANRQLKIALKNNIKEGNIDAFITKQQINYD